MPTAVKCVKSARTAAKADVSAANAASAATKAAVNAVSAVANAAKAMPHPSRAMALRTTRTWPPAKTALTRPMAAPPQRTQASAVNAAHGTAMAVTAANALVKPVKAKPMKRPKAK